MAELLPSKQTMVDYEVGTQYVITKVETIDTTTDHVKLPNAVDAAFLHASRTTSDPTFYLSSAGAQINIDGATAGTEYTIVSRHAGGMNYYRGTADADNPR